MSGVLGVLLGMGGTPGVINGALPNGTAESEANFSIASDGTYVSGASSGNWVIPATSGIAAQWQVKVDVTSGGFASGTTGTWLDASGSPLWVCQDGVAVSATFTVSFREKASQTIRSVQASVVLTATSP